MEGVIAAAALRCLGGEVQGQLWPLAPHRDRRRRRARDRRHRAHLRDRRPRRRPSRGRRDAASRAATSCAACTTSPRARAPTRSSSARAATACGSSTRSTSSHATGTRRSGCDRAAALRAPRSGPLPRRRGLPADVEVGAARGGRRGRRPAARRRSSGPSRRGLGLLTLRGGTPENTLALETLEELAAAVEELAADEDGAAGRDHRCREPDLLGGRRPQRASRGCRARRSRAEAPPRSTASPRSTCRPWPC